jgi:hypothetical protein
MTALINSGQVAGLVWELAALAFLILASTGIHKARKRGERLFRDEPMERAKALRYSTIDHTQDGL